jgi:hypothetical protein
MTKEKDGNALISVGRLHNNSRNNIVCYSASKFRHPTSAFRPKYNRQKTAFYKQKPADAGLLSDEHRKILQSVL